MPDPHVAIRPLNRPGDLGWVVLTHGETYAAEFGWDTTFEALVARILADYAATGDPDREAAWIAEVDGRRAGCVFCVAADETTAKLRLLLVDPSARGHRLGARLVDECLAFARRAGYRRMTLWTNHPLVAAAASTAPEGSRWSTRCRGPVSAPTSWNRCTSLIYDPSHSYRFPREFVVFKTVVAAAVINGADAHMLATAAHAGDVRLRADLTHAGGHVANQPSRRATVACDRRRRTRREAG